MDGQKIGKGIFIWLSRFTCKISLRLDPSRKIKGQSTFGKWERNFYDNGFG